MALQNQIALQHQFEYQGQFHHLQQHYLSQEQSQLQWQHLEVGRNFNGANMYAYSPTHNNPLILNGTNSFGTNVICSGGNLIGGEVSTPVPIPSVNNIDGPIVNCSRVEKGPQNTFNLEMNSGDMLSGHFSGYVESSPSLQQLCHRNQEHHNVLPSISEIKLEPLENLLTPTIEMQEITIKSEPSESTFQNSFINNDNTVFGDYMNHNRDQCHSHTQFHSHLQQQQHIQRNSHIVQEHQMAINTSPLMVSHIGNNKLPNTYFNDDNGMGPINSFHEKALNFPRRRLSDNLPICQRCKQVFLKKNNYIKHVTESVCDIIQYDYKCCICPMSFMSSEELHMHEQNHSENKFFCHKYCGKYFDTIELCEMHEYMHHEYQQYICNFCTMIFPTKEMLFGHTEIHKQQKRFNCSVCRLWFLTPNELHQHRLAAPYYCGRFYIPRESNRHHVMTEMSHNFNPYCSFSDGFMEGQRDNCAMKQFQTNVPFSHQNFSRININAKFGHEPLEPIIKTEYKDKSYTLGTTEFSQYFGDISINHFTNPPNPNHMPFCNENLLGNIYENDHSSHSKKNIQSNKTAHLPNSDCALNDVEDFVCCVPRCEVRKSTSTSLQFFPFPKDEKFLVQWLHNLKLDYNPQEDYNQYRICSLHFPKRCINRYSLCYWAVPTFNLGHDDVGNIYQNRELTNTFTSVENSECSMPGCNSKRGESNLKFYNFPKDTRTLIKWCENAQLPVYGKEPRHFCSRHFEERCFGKFRLKPWAIPTINLNTPMGKIHDNPGVMHLEEKKCCLLHCRRARSSDFNLSLYRFPRDDSLLKKWCHNLRLDPSVYRGKNHKICSAHFIKEALGLRKLSPGAVPTLNLGHNDSCNLYQNELNTASNTSAVESTANNSASIVIPKKSHSRLECNGTSAGNTFDPADICCVPSCKRTRHSDNITLHTIPRRTEQMKKWCHNLKIDLNCLKGVRICSAHFEPFCIGGCMRPFAVPTLNLGHDDPNIFKNPDVIKKLNIRETCCIAICRRNRDRDHANLHRFPSNKEMFEKWCANLKKPLPDDKKLFNDAICEVHFEERCLKNKRLEKWAIPTLKLGHESVMYELPNEDEVALLCAKSSSSNINNGEEEGQCCIQSCNRNPQVDDIKLYRPPDDMKVLLKWSHNLQMDMEIMSGIKICNLHFESHCIGKRMHSWAIPTLNLGQNIENLYENPDVPILLRKRRVSKKQEPVKWTPRCCLSHCRNTRGNGVQLFRFPLLNRNMLAKWCHNLQLPLVGNGHRRLCSAHFEPHVLTKRCPMPMSVPTIELNTPINYKIYQNPSKLKFAKLRLECVCVIATCRKKRNEGIQLFRYPHNRRLLKKWCHNTHQKSNEAIKGQYRVCSLHFEPHSFGTKRLSPGAIPTLNLGHDDKDIFPNEAQSFADLKCIVPGCNASIDNVDRIKLFKFPENDDLLWKWCNNLKMNPIDCRGVRICQKHFDVDCLAPKSLYKWAIPTLYLGHDDSDIELICNPNKDERYASEVIAKCCALNCGKSRKYDEAQMNSFPKDNNMFQRWKHNLKLDYLEFKNRDKYKICNDHFESLCLGKNRLYHGAIPTLNLGHDDNSIFRVNPVKIKKSLLSKKRRNLIYTKECINFSKNDGATIILEKTDNKCDVIKENEAILANIKIDTKEIANEKENPCNDNCNVLTCCYPFCTTPNKLLEKMFDLPTNNKLQEIWLKYIKVNKDQFEENGNKLCGLHFMEIYKVVLDVVTDLIALHDDLQEEQNILEQVFESCCKSMQFRAVRCSVFGCNTTEFSCARLFEFPKKGSMRKKWKYNTNIYIDKEHRHCFKVCSLHFETHCFITANELQSWAVPTLLLNHPKPMTIYRGPKIDTNPDECCIEHCDKNSNSSEIVMFSFPLGKIMMKKWCHNLQIHPNSVNKQLRICSLHFHKKCMNGKYLHKWAKPTLQLGHTDLIYKNPKSLPGIFLPHCVVPNCLQRRTLENNLRTFGFPKDVELLEKWCKNFRIDPKECKGRVCVEHFEPIVVGNRKLKVGAVPTLNLGHNDSPIYDNKILIQSLNNTAVNEINDDGSSLLQGYIKSEDNKDDEAIVPPIGPIKFKRSVNNIYPICCLRHCRKEKTQEQHLTTFGFPKDQILLKKWSENLNLELEQCVGRVCINHFELRVVGQRRLKIGAVPTINVGHELPLKHNNSSSLDLEIERDAVGRELKEKREEDSLLNNSEQSKMLNLNTEKLINRNFRICCLKHCRRKKSKKSKNVRVNSQIESTQSNKIKTNIQLFPFPSQHSLLWKWCFNTKQPVKRYVKRKICSKHFERSAFMNGRLRRWALPTKNLGHCDAIYKNLKRSQKIINTFDCSKAKYSDVVIYQKLEEVESLNKINNEQQLKTNNIIHKQK